MTTLAEQLKCITTSVVYHGGSRTLFICMLDGHCTDMTGAIRLARSFDPDVRRIETTAGERLDTVYMRDDDDDEVWSAIHDGRRWPPGRFPWA